MGRQWEFMDHTADVILHSWGCDMKEAWEQVCVCFFAYMTELEKVELKATVEVEASGHDILDLLYHLLDEFLFSFGSEFIICRRIELLELDTENLRARARGYGERFDLAKHPQGTEIKAITMHQMKVLTPRRSLRRIAPCPARKATRREAKYAKGFHTSATSWLTFDALEGSNRNSSVGWKETASAGPVFIP